MSYLSCYLAGEHEAVWAELTALGPAVREEPVFSDAQAVARETMTRVRENAERVVAALREIGYVFKSEDGMPTPLLPKPIDASEMLADLEGIIDGPLPLSLRAFYEIVGPISLRGEHPQWRQLPYPDELIIEPLEDLEEGGLLIPRSEYEPDEEGYVLQLAPDFYHKADVSGGAPYSVVLPDAAADVRLDDERHDTTFVNYLRIAFRFGGFPGADLAATPADRGIAGTMPPEHLARLTRDLRAF